MKQLKRIKGNVRLQVIRAKANMFIQTEENLGLGLHYDITNDDNYETINVITRKKVTVQSKKIKNYIIDFTNPDGYKKVIKKGDVVIASIGTTQSKVNFNKTKYRKVDYDILLNIAKACKSNQASSFCFVSSAGANEKSKNFYLGLKGEIENSIMHLALNSCLIFRPSLLLGKRNEFRFIKK